MGYFIVGFFVGILLGLLITKFNNQNKKPIGDLVVDRSDEDGPLLFLELNESLPNVEKSEQVVLNVVHKNYISQK